MLASALLPLSLLLSTVLAKTPITPNPSANNTITSNPSTTFTPITADASTADTNVVARFGFYIEGALYWMVINSVITPGPNGIESLLLSAANLAYDGVREGGSEVALDTHCSAATTVASLGISMAAGFDFAHFDDQDWHDILEYFTSLVTNEYDFPTTLVGTITNPAVGSIAYATISWIAENGSPVTGGRVRRQSVPQCSGLFGSS